MRVFDTFGVVAVATWLAVIGYFVYDTYVAPKSHALEAGAVFREGESYMLLTREDAEVGYIYESRTHVSETDSWLLEYDLVMNVSMLGINQYLQTKIKAKVSRAAILEDFSAAIETGGTRFDLTGDVDGNVVTMKMNLAGQDRTQKIELKEPPRLSNSALNELVANPDLQPGMMFEQEYFDPTTMGMTTMTFEYVRQHEILVYDVTVQTYHFRQQVAGTELDAYVDKYGEVQLQEFPLRIVGARLPVVLGRSRAQAIRKKFEDSRGNELPGDAPDLSLEATVDLLKSGDLGGSVATSRYRISDIPEGVRLELDSQQQRVTSKKENTAEIDTAERYDGSADGGIDLDPLLQSDLRVDAEHESFAALLAADAPESPTLRAEMIGRAVRKRMRAEPEIGIQTASAALEGGSGDCTEYALVLAAALRHHKIAARFVSGVKADEKGQFVVHQWVQYWDGARFTDMDATSTTLLPGIQQIQLFTHAGPDKPELATVIGELSIEKIFDEPEKTGDAASDFN